MKTSLIASFAVLVLSVLGSIPANGEIDGPVEFKMDQPHQYKSILYGQLELRHYTDNFYDDEGYLSSQKPYISTRGRFGFRLYRGTLDIYTVLGFIKQTETQKVVQKRPLLVADYYPVDHRYGEILIYNMVEAPFSESDFDSRNGDPERQGSIYTIGVAPVVRYDFRVFGGPLWVSFGGDFWTKTYSRRQSLEEDSMTEDEFGLVGTWAEQPEDHVARLYTQYKTGLSYSPDYKRQFVHEFFIYYDNSHYPFYSIEPDESLDHEYKTLRRSKFRFRMTWILDKRVYLRNDYYKYYSGLFKSSLTGKHRQSRNIFYVGYKF